MADNVTRDMLPDSVTAVDYAACEAAIKSGDVDLAWYRKLYKGKLKRETKLSDQQLTALITAVTDDCDPPVWLHLMQTTEQKPITVEAETSDRSDTGETTEDPKPDDAPLPKASDSKELQLASEMAAHVSTATEDHVRTFTKAKREVLSSSVRVYFDLVRDFKPEQLRKMPYPGTDKTDARGSTGPDKFAYAGTENGKPKTFRTSTWRELAKNTAFGAECFKNLNYIKAVIAGDKSPSIPESFRILPTEADQEGVKKMWSKELDNVVLAYTSGYKLWYAMDQFKTKLPNIGLTWLYVQNAKGENTDEILDSGSPLRIYNKNDPTKTFAVPVSTFNLYDHDAIAKAGGTYADLLKTALRGTGDDENNSAKAAEMKKDGTVEDLIGVWNIMLHWVETGKHIPQLEKDLSNDETKLLTFGDMVMAFDDVFEHHKDAYRVASSARRKAAQRDKSDATPDTAKSDAA